jgi:manganese oxidase
VRLTEFAIDPADLTVPAGVPVTITVTNHGVAPHDLTIEGLAATEILDAGESETLEVGPLDAGSYPVLCSVSGHDAAGLTGTLTVTDEHEAVLAAEEAHEDHAGGHGAGLGPEELARLHDEGVAAFPVETEVQGNQPLEPEVLADGTKVFELTADEIEWETKPGVVKAGMAYNGQIPGPQLRVDLGDSVRIVLHNELDEPTALHGHGLVLPNDMDGVPGLTQPSILPGESFTYEFEVRNAGSHMYHSHFNSAEQVTKGLQIHPMHLHGIPQQVIAKDGYPLPRPHYEDTVLVGPGERIDVLVEATEPGAWALHCHVLTHAEGPDGMFGMVTALIVEE